ncbi:DUF3168 domain-containing protein [Jannaschia sp. LMIT008]|uniref:DUF3168 domain-containing protein n=1 Tax=Jannaschia maritima TaxID=3032585 RepID=UPI002811C326|nr:DUF3168 domain-containing protein [Jannaschia sp. LMIT008]
MSYEAGAALQKALFDALSVDSALRELVGTAIHDADPDGAADLYVVLGPERVAGASDATGAGAVHRATIGVVTTRAGFRAAKAAAARISAILHDASLPLATGRLVALDFLDARASRDRTARTRRVDMTFRARIEL